MASKSLFAVILLAIIFQPFQAAVTRIQVEETLSSEIQPNLYEISTRPWLYELSLKYGRPITKLSDIPISEFQALANAGIKAVWMMGMWHLGPYGLHYDQTDPDHLADYARNLPGYTQADIIGSPYAVTNFTCNPTIGTDSDVAALKKTLNSLGLLLYLDFVPNHTAVDSPWTYSNIEYYVRAPPGTPNPDPNQYLPNGIAYGGMGYGAWMDTAQLNYFNPATRQAMTEALLKVASVADGIRCDMAFLDTNDLFQTNWGSQLAAWGWSKPPTEFWKDAISAVKAKYPDVKFMAETYGYETYLQSLGFDFTYEKTLYDRLANGNLDGIREWIASHSESFFKHAAHFTENHDEARAVAEFGSWWRADAAALVTMTLPGLRLYNHGQFEGKAARLLVQLRRSATEPINTNTVSFYQKLLQITSADVFHLGTWTYLNVFGADTAWRLMAWRWEYGSERRLVVINYSDTEGQGKIVLTNAVGENGGDNVTVTDLLSGTSYVRSASDMRTNGLYAVVNSWYGQIFKY